MAGVSVSAASVALSGKAVARRISPDAIERVKTAAAALDYSPNLLVRSIQRGRTNVISFLSGFRQLGNQDRYMDTLMSCIEHACGAVGYDLLVSCNFKRTPEEMYRAITGGLSDGLIFFAPSVDDAMLPFLRSSRFPVVLVNGNDAHAIVPSVSDDVDAGMRSVANRLVALGHRNIAVLTNTQTLQRDADHRVRALCERVREHGLHIARNWVVDIPEASQSNVFRAMDGLMEGATRPSALFCWHDLVGYRVLDYCEANAIDVPSELSIIGYDGIRWPTQSRHVLASVEVDLAELANTAVSMLHSRISQESPEYLRALIPTTMTVGTTIGPAL